LLKNLGEDRNLLRVELRQALELYQEGWHLRVHLEQIRSLEEEEWVQQEECQEEEQVQEEEWQEVDQDLLPLLSHNLLCQLLLLVRLQRKISISQNQ
jgi:hypothetical protein